MARFTFTPVGIDDFRSGTSVFPFTAHLDVDAATLWAQLNGPTPLSCGAENPYRSTMIGVVASVVSEHRPFFVREQS